MSLLDRAGGARAAAPGLLPPLLLVAAWIVLSSLHEGPRLIPEPSSVWQVLRQPFHPVLSSGSLAWHSVLSLIRVMAGFTAATAVGIPLGVLMGAAETPRRLLTLSVELARPLSPLALVPLSLVLFRSRSMVDVLGLDSLRYTHHILHEIQPGMIFVLFWGAVFPILLGTVDGVRSCRRIHIEAARTLGAGGFFLFRTILLPSALPEIFTGLRLGIGRCWMVIIAAEMLPGTNVGLGYLIRYSYEVQRLDIMLSGMILTGLVGAAMSLALQRLGRGGVFARVEDR